jgi:AAA domain
MNEQAPPNAVAESSLLKADTVSAASITMKRVRWLWDQKIPLGELTIAAGREGAAKSQFTIWEATHVTRGTTAGDLSGQPAAVIVCAREDSWEHTIAPRLFAAGAELSMVYRVRVKNIHSGRAFDLLLPEDNELLEGEIIRLNAAMVVFDPLLSVLSGKLNTHRASDVRSALEPLADMAHRTGAAMVGLAHFAKMEGRDAASLISGSHAFKDVARSILVFARDDEDTGIMSHVKNNLGRLPRQSLAYRIRTQQIQVSDGVADVPVFELGQPTMRHVEDLLDQGKARELAKARDFLRRSLMGRWRLSRELEEEARQHGISPRTLDRARTDLGVIPSKAPDGKWWVHF